MFTVDRPIVVTGASGNLGAAVIHSLTAAGLPARAAGTNPDALGAQHPSIPAVHLDLHDPRTFGPALDGAGGLFLVRPPAIATVGPTLNALLDAAQHHELDHVVFSSVAGADTNRMVPHHRVETHLRASTLSWTILRPGFFAQNLADAYVNDIRDDNRIYLPAGAGRAAFIDAHDIGDAAAVVFSDPATHRGAGYHLTGPTAVSFDEVAHLLSRELGRPIAYAPASILGYFRHARRKGLPTAQASVQTVLHTGLRRGQAEQVDPTLPRLLGRAPRTLEQYIQEHRATWASTVPQSA